MNRVLARICLAGFILLFCGSAVAKACRLMGESDKPAPLNVLFIQSNTASGSFWDYNRQFTEAVADDLGIHLETVSLEVDETNPVNFYSIIQEKLLQSTPPDLIISILYPNGEIGLLDLIEEHQTPFFSFNTSLEPKTRKFIGKPRGQYQYWIAHMSPNDFLGGYALTAQISAKAPNNPMAVLGGPALSMVSQNRLRGLSTAAQELHIVHLPIVTTDWSVQGGHKSASTVLNRMPNTHSFWTAGPDIAEGLLKVLAERPNFDWEQLVLGSFDWSQNAIEMMRDGVLDYSYGGHFMESGWALILAYDYLNGLDFNAELGSEIHTPLLPMHRDNVKQIASLMAQQKWLQVDFTRYSKCLNPQQQEYNLKLPARLFQSE